MTAAPLWLSIQQLERATWRPDDELIGRAGVVLDALLTGAIDAPDLAPVREDMRWVVSRMSGALTSDLAPRAARCLLWRKQRRSWPAKLGLYIEQRYSEHDYACLFCGASLDTVSDKSGTPRRIPRDKITRWERHAAECACQIALEIERWNKAR